MLKEEDVAPFDEDFNLLFKVTSDLLVDGPVLLFCMYRQTCEECVSNFAERLEAQEKEDGLIKLALSEKKEKARANAKAKSDKKLAKMSAGDKQREEFERQPQGDTMETAPDPTAFTLRRPKSSMGKDKREAIIEKMMHELRWDVSHPLVRGLRRGVGCHHGGLPHKYRVAVELLFRTGDLGAVFATTTLAMGIHAPARSAVILKDTTFLNGTSLRQMAGRAGRRGFDDLGNCVFLGVSYHRIKSLFNSLVPTMRGSFPLSVSLVYRMKLLEQWNTENNYVNISQSLSQMMKQPLLGGGQNASLQHFSEFAAPLEARVGSFERQGRRCVARRESRRTCRGWIPST